ncbi:type IV pilus assembly protein FimV [Hydrogenophaga sp.]|uniref:type IV pilus assembly protein FimV n=1 Tax=Hydrogenophaga sp. TaxID=1904254 RepID=UPI002FCA19FF
MSSSAVTLGRHSGAAMIGHTLDVRVQVLLAPGEDLANLCIETDVFYGDTQVSPSLVRTSPQRTTPDAEASVRVQSHLPVNEPFVTLYVRAGCGTQFTRRFVLLADLVNEPVTAAAQPSTGALPTAPVAVAPSGLPRATAAASAPGAPSSSATASPAAQASGTSQRRPVAPARADALPPRAPSVVRRAPVKPPVAAAPRLQLDPIDLSTGIERDPTLKLSPVLLSEPSTSEEARAAAAQLWKSINASPEDVLREGQKLVALESEVARLRQEQTQAQAALGDLNSQLERSQAQRYQNWLVYLLGGLLLLALLAVLLVWRRRQEVVVQGSEASRAWWAPEEEEKTVLVPLQPDAGASKVASGLTPLSSGVDLDIDLDQDSSFDGLASSNETALSSKGARVNEQTATPLSARDRREFSTSALGVSRSVATEELFDVQQQADFFVSLGEDEQAIQVLKDHLTESHEPSALTYMDLFHIYHRLGRRSDYERLREEFNHVFNAGAPPFDSYSQRGRGLEAYETAFSRIQALWPEPRVLDLIEQSIFRDASDGASEVFDLEAYRELLMLHAIAKDLIQRDNAAPRTTGDFQHTAMQPLKAADKSVSVVSVSLQDASERHTQPMGLDNMSPASSRLGLDINLDDFAEMDGFEALLPEVNSAVEPSARPTQPADFEIREAEGNLIDFEVLDFDLPNEPDGARTSGKKT